MLVELLDLVPDCFMSYNYEYMTYRIIAMKDVLVFEFGEAKLLEKYSFLILEMNAEFSVYLFLYMWH